MTTTELLFAGVPVADFAAAVAWYGRLFGRPADVVVAEAEVMWRVAPTGWVYVIADAGHAGHALVTISVSDLDEAIAELNARGITPNAVEVIDGAGRKAPVTDPDGNTIAFIEVPSR
ncbi:MAG TPA: VOC family protein [Actinomycetes bacterium]